MKKDTSLVKPLLTSRVSDHLPLPLKSATLRRTYRKLEDRLVRVRLPSQDQETTDNNRGYVLDHFFRNMLNRGYLSSVSYFSGPTNTQHSHNDFDLEFLSDPHQLHLSQENTTSSILRLALLRRGKKEQLYVCNYHEGSLPRKEERELTIHAAQSLVSSSIPLTYLTCYDQSTFLSKLKGSPNNMQANHHNYWNGTFFRGYPVSSVSMLVHSNKKSA